jgi:hypothetical protein
MIRTPRSQLLAALLAVALLGPIAAAQTITGTVVGRIVDDRGQPLEGAVVRLVNLRSGFAYATRTDALGLYRVELLPPSQYRITAEKEGFRPGTIERFRAEVNSTKEIIPPPITLYPVAAPPAVAPAEARLQANTSDAALRGSAVADLIVALPLPGLRSFDALALLVPGVAPAPQTRGTAGPGIGPGVGTAGQFSVNGRRARSNNFTVDGSDNNDQDVGVRRQGFTAPASLPAESIAEFEITTHLADAEAGRNTGGQVNVVGRSGANSLHGEAYAFVSDRRLNARDFFDLDGESPFTRVQAGATVGGPVARDRAHYFGAIERLAVDRIVDAHFATPTLAERNAAIRGVRDVRLFAFDLLAPPFIPLPNDPGGPYGANTHTRALDASGDATLATLRLDGQPRWLGWQATASARYAFAGDETSVPAVDGALNASLVARTRSHNLAFAYNAALSERVANQLRVSFGRTSLAFDEVAGSPFVFSSPGGRTGPVGRLVVAPYSPIGVDPYTFPQGRANNTFQIADTLLVARGRHALKAGADVRRTQLNSFLDRNYRAEINFAGGFRYDGGQPFRVASGLQLAAYGLASDISQALAVVPDSSLALRFTETSLFAHDAWRPHPRVAVGLGLRYEHNTVPRDASGRLERALTLEEGDIPGSGSDDPAVREFFARFGALRARYDGREAIYEGDADDFAPRAGVAWDLTGTGRLAVRAGYGLFYDALLGTVVGQSRNVFPSFIPLNLGAGVIFPELLSINPALLPVPLIAPGTLNTLGVGGAAVPELIGQLLFVGGADLAFTLPARRLRTPYVHQYSLTVEAVVLDEYLVTVSYAGSAGRKLLRLRTPNGGQSTTVRVVPSTNSVAVLFGRGERPDALLGPYTEFGGSASSSYDALQVSVVRRPSEGLDLRFAYTWSHAIDDVSDVFDTAGSSSVAADELGLAGGLRAERGDAAFDVRHRAVAAWRYELPFDRTVEVSGVATFQTGQPFTVLAGVDANLDGNLTDRLGTDRGLLGFDGGRTRLALAPGVTLEQLLGPLGEDDRFRSAVGRNTFRSAGVATVDLAASKRIALGRGHAVTVRVEAFNVFNRTHFAVPVRVVNAPGFGSSVATSVPPRTVQLAVRYTF